MNKDLRAILESDLLERYLMGEANAQEQAKVQVLRQTSPEIRQVLDDLEATLEKVALEEQVAPPPGLRDKILRQNYHSAPRTPVRRTNFTWLAYAASLLLLTCSAWFWQQRRINDLTAEAAAYTEQIAQIEADCATANRQFALLKAPDTKPLVMTGTDYAPESSLLVYWNPTERACLLRVFDLPDLPADKTYQLWADVDGEMKSLGTFDHRAARDELFSMAFLANAASLNVTVEAAGGSDHATVETLTAVVGV